MIFRMRVFLSYSPQDKAVVDRLEKSLRKAGHTPWRFDREVFLGDNPGAAIAQALESCDAMVVVYSGNSEQSSMQAWEVGYALGAPRYRDKVIPLLVGEAKKTEIPWVLRPELLGGDGRKSIDAGVSAVIASLGSASQITRARERAAGIHAERTRVRQRFAESQSKSVEAGTGSKSKAASRSRKAATKARRNKKI